jgi:hypothetical protein
MEYAISTPIGNAKCCHRFTLESGVTGPPDLHLSVGRDQSKLRPSEWWKFGGAAPPEAGLTVHLF